MSLFEWFGESFNPGPVGHIDVTGRPLFAKPVKRFWAIAVMFAGFAVLYFGALLILSFTHPWVLCLGFVLYLLLCYFLTPVADSSNIGWAGGLINNPFRISDDINRFLIIFYLFLLPGKLVVFAFQTLYRLVKYNL